VSDTAIDGVDAEAPAFLRPALPRALRWLSPPDDHALVRFAMLRLLGLVYFVAFLITIRQFRPLIGANGLLPAQQLLAFVQRSTGSKLASFAHLPTIFWFGCSDAAIAVCAWIGAILSLLVLLGATNAVVQLVIWALYLSIAQIGGKFYGYGWESQLCETGFLAIFLCPIRTIAPFRASAPPAIAIVLHRWLIARIMIGAGLIKLRGDPCWRNFTCLIFHYETQPNPNPIAWLLNAAPPWFHKIGVGFNHLVELVAPVFAFGPRRARIVAGILFVSFQAFLIASGNLSFLNWLTIVPALACFDDRALARVLPSRVRRFLDERESSAPSPLHRNAAWVLACVVAILSVQPIVNLFSPEQKMNRSFEPLRLVNTYGAFGSMQTQRFEVVLQGTRDENVDEHTVWIDYELPCKPGDPNRRPCFLSPYHHRLDWQLWFCSFRDLGNEAWLAHLAYKLLRGDPIVRPLFARDPFPDAPPRWVRAEVYWYRFTRPGEKTKAWWRRSHVDEYLPPVRVDTPELLEFLERHGFVSAP